MPVSHDDREAGRRLVDEMADARRDAAIMSERLVTLARPREMETRHAPTTSADDVEVAIARSNAVSMIVAVVEQNSQIRSADADSVLGMKGGRPAKSARVSIGRKVETMRDTLKRERQDILSAARAGENTEVEEEKDGNPRKLKARWRDRGFDAGW